MKTITEHEVRDSLKATVADVISDFAAEPETSRDTLIERLDEECDTLFGQLVQSGPVSAYDVDDLARTAQPCAGVLASIAFFSLRNLLYQYLKDAGHDTNDDYPFALDEED